MDAARAFKRGSLEPVIVNRLFFCGDPHGHFEHIIVAVRTHRPTAVVLLGEVRARKPLDLALEPILNLTEVRWVKAQSVPRRSHCSWLPYSHAQ